MTVHPLPGGRQPSRPVLVQAPSVLAIAVGVWLICGVAGAFASGILVLAAGILGIVIAEWMRIAARRALERDAAPQR